MMHPAAEEWDNIEVREPRYSMRTGKLAVNYYDKVPQGSLGPKADRPCDLCGVPLGVDGIYIHEDCLIQEREAAISAARKVHANRIGNVLLS